MYLLVMYSLPIIVLYTYIIYTSAVCSNDDVANSSLHHASVALNKINLSNEMVTVLQYNLCVSACVVLDLIKLGQFLLQVLVLIFYIKNAGVVLSFGQTLLEHLTYTQG